MHVRLRKPLAGIFAGIALSRFAAGVIYEVDTALGAQLVSWGADIVPASTSAVVISPREEPLLTDEQLTGGVTVIQSDAADQRAQAKAEIGERSNRSKRSSRSNRSKGSVVRSQDHKRQHDGSTRTRRYPRPCRVVNGRIHRARQPPATERSTTMGTMNTMGTHSAPHQRCRRVTSARCDADRRPRYLRRDGQILRSPRRIALSQFEVPGAACDARRMRRKATAAR